MNLFSKEIPIILISLKIAISSTIIVIPLALIISSKLYKSNFLIRLLMEVFINLPLTLPPVATGFLLLLLFGRNGVFGKFLFEIFSIKITFTFIGAVLAASVISFPIAVRSIRVSMESINTDLLKAAETLGVSNIKIFFGITLPLIWPGILSGAILTFIRSLGEFGATMMIAGTINENSKTLSVSLWTALQEPGKEAYMYKLLLFCIIISVISIFISEILIKKIKIR